MKKAVVVGGSGFLGSHVADKLSEAGYEVYVYDCVQSPWLKQGQHMVLGEVKDKEKLEDTISGSEVVYNFAALADLNRALNNPLQTVEVNILGNLNVMDACLKYEVKRFLYASTVYVHSREGGFYRCSKQASEAYIEEYHRTYGLEYTILRYGSLYGPRADNSNGIWRIVNTAVNEGRIRYEGHPDSMREYIHVEDAATASIDVLSSKYANENIVLTGQEPMSVVDALKMLAEIMGLEEDKVEFVEGNYAGHYVRTPYAHQPKVGRKYIPPIHVDFGQGLLQVITDLSESKE